MSCKRLAAMFIPLFIAGAAFAEPPSSGHTGTEKPMNEAKASEGLSVLHAVSEWSSKLSQMAELRARSELVKDYARTMATSNAKADAKLKKIAEKHGLAITPLDPQDEENKSLLDRMRAETTLLGSLEGDAFDKEYMTLVTNTQQSVIHHLESTKASAKDPEVKQLLGEMTTMVQERLKTAQDIMAKVYADKI